MSVKFKINSNVQIQIFPVKRDPARLKSLVREKLTFGLLKLVFGICFVIGILSLVIHKVYAEEVTILYTGETHAMLYPCNCPKEPDGGIARRGALIKKLRKENPNTLLLDSGGFFAGGLMDENTQNMQFDQERTRINLKAIGLMRYDALALGDDEFNFGRAFLEENMRKINIPLLACNIAGEEEKNQEPAATLNMFKPYIVKQVGGLKFGIIGLTTPLIQQKAPKLKLIDPKLALMQAVKELKEQHANIIVLLSHLGERDDVRLITSVQDIDILVVGHSREKEEAYSKINNTLIVRPSWQGRRLGKITITVKDNKFDYKVEEIRLSDKISDDTEMLSFLPRCFSDANCKREGSVGMCQDPGSLKSRCFFTEATEVPLTVITAKDCAICNPEKMINSLKAHFPGLKVSYLYYPEAKAAALVKDSAFIGLPAFLLGREAEKEKGFETLKDNLELKGNFFVLKPEAGGFSYVIDYAKEKGKLDLFLSLYDKNSKELLDSVRDFNPSIHFLAVESHDRFEAGKGDIEVEEDLRSVCVQKYYPEKFWGYISCRAANSNSSWWDDCISGIESEKIKQCARSKEGQDLLRENTRLNKKLKIMLGPTFLMDNKEIFGLTGIPSKEEFKKILKR